MSQGAPRRSPMFPHVVHVWLRESTFGKLEQEASRRGLHRDWLAARLIEVATADGLVDAILDGE